MNILLEQCMIAPGLGDEDLTKIGDIWWKTCIEKRIGQGYGGAANHSYCQNFYEKRGVGYEKFVEMWKSLRPKKPPAFPHFHKLGGDFLLSIHLKTLSRWGGGE